MASQLSSEVKMDEKMDSSTSTETTGKAGRSIPPPLFSLENLYEVQNRHRSCTNTSLDSSSNCSLATTANTSTAPGTPYLVTPTGHHQQQQQNRQQHTIHRPRAVLPSSMSLDSGVAEVSPMYQLVRQFRYGESVVAGNGGGGGVELMNTSTGSGAAAAVPAVHNDGADAAGLLINNGGNGQQHGSNNHNITEFSFGGGALDDSIEGEDEELISIGHHFTPISAPSAAAASAAADLSQAAEVFRFPSVVPGATTAAAGNLATERRANRMGYGGNRHQHYSADNHHYYHRQAAEVNNNDPGFRNLNHNSAPAGGGPPAHDMMFDFDEFGDEDDDDVFYNGGAPAEEEEDHSPPMRESRSWHIARPSCIIGGDAVDGFCCDNDEEEGAHAAGSRSAQLFSCSSSSRRSSSPIPIPSSRTNSTSSNCNFDSFFETSAAAGQQPMSSTFMSPPSPSPSLLGSVPQPITRMPYYHQMAPPLLLPIAARKEEGEVAEVGGDSSRAFHQHHRRTAPFGTHFETSCSIITRSLVPSRFSPVPFHGRWYPNPQAVQRGHLLRQAVNNGLGQPPPTSYHLRFGRLPASPTYPLRAIPTDFRALTPTWEMDEPVEEEEAEKAGTAASAAASYELIFNFSQLSVNEISGEVMDIEVADGSGDDLHRHEDSEEGGDDGGDGGSPLQQSIFSKASTSSSTSSSSCSSFSSSPSSPSAPQLPDIVSSHRSASFRERSAVAAASKHLHRNTLPSFNAEHISSASVSGGSPHHHYHHHQAAEPRRTMSVSLPIEEHVISSVASQLRQISSDFSSSRQIIRSTGFNPLSSLSPVLDLIASAALLFGNGGRGSSSSTSSSSSASRIITRRQTFHGGNANTNGGNTSSTSSRRVVNNSRFYTSSTTSTNEGSVAAQAHLLPPTPTTTGNSTFYVGTTTATSSAKTKSGK